LLRESPAARAYRSSPPAILLFVNSVNPLTALIQLEGLFKK
jgi:hypothetical protein